MFSDQIFFLIFIIMNTDKFFETFLKVHDEIDCHDGLQLVWNGEFAESYRYKLSVPIYKVVNPNNSPYTEESLSYFMIDTIDNFRKIMPIMDKSFRSQYLYRFDYQTFSVFIPIKIQNKIQSCLSKVEVEDQLFDAYDKEYLVSGKFDGDFDFETDGETVIVTVDFRIDSVTLDGENIYDEEELESIKDEMYGAYSDWYDNATWPCFSNLYENDNFMTKNEMGWNTGVRIFI